MRVIWNIVGGVVDLVLEPLFIYRKRNAFHQNWMVKRGAVSKEFKPRMMDSVPDSIE